MPPLRDASIMASISAHFEQGLEGLEDLSLDVRSNFEKSHEHILAHKRELSRSKPDWDETNAAQHEDLDVVWDHITSHYQACIGPGVEGLFQRLDAQSKSQIDALIREKVGTGSIAEDVLCCLRSAIMLSSNDRLFFDGMDVSSIIFEACKAVEIASDRWLREGLDENLPAVRDEARKLNPRAYDLTKYLQTQEHIRDLKFLPEEGIRRLLNGLADARELDKILTGPKSVGLAILIFGRDYSFSIADRFRLRIENPLRLKLSESQALKLGSNLIELQNMRNGYAHKMILTLDCATQYTDQKRIVELAFGLISNLTTA